VLPPEILPSDIDNHRCLNHDEYIDKYQSTHRRNHMSRVQLALNVGDLDEAIAFYSKLFQTEPAKVREGYANFAITNPPLKLVLIAGDGAPGTMNHVGVEVESTDEVAAAITRFQSEDMPTDVRDQESCCFAVQDKVWVQGPDIAWEIYTVLGEAPQMACVASNGGTQVKAIPTPVGTCC
jgi:predicted enzyme related to lactoylglutathione lyase